MLLSKDLTRENLRAIRNQQELINAIRKEMGLSNFDFGEMYSETNKNTLALPYSKSDIKELIDSWKDQGSKDPTYIPNMLNQFFEDEQRHGNLTGYLSDRDIGDIVDACIKDITIPDLNIQRIWPRLWDFKNREGKLTDKEIQGDAEKKLEEERKRNAQIAYERDLLLKSGKLMKGDLNIAMTLKDLEYAYKKGWIDEKTLKAKKDKIKSKKG